MPSLTELKRQGYRLQRVASHGATITLVAGYGYYSALFECANYIAGVLGTRDLQDIGDGLLEVIPHYRIPTEDLFEALTKLSKKFSIALVEYNCAGKNGGQFIGIWRINRVGCTSELPIENITLEAPLEQFSIVDMTPVSSPPLTNYLDEY